MRRVTLCLAVLLAATALLADEAPLPPAGFLGRFKAEPAETFTGAELYGHIDGGAEIFLELGFEQLTVAHYAAAPDEITVEAYRMSDPTAALAIYLERCGAETPAKDVGARHTAGTHQLMLAKGAWVVFVNNDTGRPASAPLLVDFARAVAGKIAAAPAVDPAAGLPPEGMVPGSLRLIRGPVGLSSFVSLGEGDVLRLGGRVTAHAAEYVTGSERFARVVVDFPSTEAAAGALASVKARLDSALTPLRSTDTRLVYRDWQGRFGVVEVAGARLELRANLAKDPG